LRLLRYINESVLDKGLLKATFLGGHSGAGKSHVLSKLTSGEIEPRIVNTDKFTEFLKAFKIEQWPEFEGKVKLLTKNQLTLNLNSMLPLWIDGTSSNPSSLLRRKGILSSIGYDTAMIWVNCSLETAIERAKKRAREVPEKFIREVYSKMDSLKPYYKKEFRDFMVVNNDDGELTDKVVLKAFKKSIAFFNSPVANPIGKKLIEEMKSDGHKYLIDTQYYDMAFLKKLVSTWYQS
jgi:predicted kinase